MKTIDDKAEINDLDQPVSSWTPGPWSVEYEDDPGTTITIPEIGRVLHDWDWAAQEDWTRDLANARLIAAAPELYAALEMARSAMIGKVSPRSSAWGYINTALAKARGEA